MATASEICQALLSDSYCVKMRLRGVEKYICEKEKLDLATCCRRCNTITMVLTKMYNVERQGWIYFTISQCGARLQNCLRKVGSSTKLRIIMGKREPWNLCIIQYTIMKITSAYL